VILVDTSVLISLIKGDTAPKTEQLRQLAASGVPFGISDHTVLEVLAGARGETEFETLRTYLASQRIYSLPSSGYQEAARIYLRLRRAGFTPRGQIDLVIAQTAIHHSLALLHNDRDFDVIARHTPELAIA
jgi:predicted nucleic acid-binding protein